MDRRFLLCFLPLLLIPLFLFTGHLNTSSGWIPPTNAFDKIHTNSGSVYSTNSSMPLNIFGGTGISTSGTNSSHTVTISCTLCSGGSSGKGSYNTTQANNVNVNTGGFKLNFINGTGNPVNVVNSKAGTQVNVTISSSSSPTLRILSGTDVPISGNSGSTIVVNFNPLRPYAAGLGVTDPNQVEYQPLAGHIKQINVVVFNWSLGGGNLQYDITPFKNGARLSAYTMILTGNGFYTFTPTGVSWNAGDYLCYLYQTDSTFGAADVFMVPVYSYP